MDDLISRQAAIDAICEHGVDLERRGITVIAVVNHKQATVDLLENLPSAERRGKKKVFYHGENTFSYVCDQCAMPIDGKDAFCRWCGAKMEV